MRLFAHSTDKELVYKNIYRLPWAAHIPHGEDCENIVAKISSFILLHPPSISNIIKSNDPHGQYVGQEFQRDDKSHLLPKTPEEEQEEERLIRLKALKNVVSKHFGIKVKKIDATLDWIKSLRESIYQGNLSPEIMASSPLGKLGAVDIWRKVSSMKQFLTLEGLVKFRSDFETELKQM
ncbi:hypothetical protein PGT21_033482 [Puccinia graminis f. sp. tritici]|uniref:Uncharacterized protein n=1 Tax=Puccinia graminis f. sp. tritici TaxID=56615 RepID=A0A5B0MML6_PUCGR|nr:hypothetical protein PGT21_033482 [Puccinia graminis f. sp. tritici]